LQSQGISTLVLEAHSLIGGCASYFQRKNFLFDVGATTFSGLSEHGTVTKFQKQTGLNFHVKRLDPGMIIFLDFQKITRYANQQEWIEESSRVFGPEGQKEFWNQMYKINNSAWEFLSENSMLPPANWKDVFSLVRWKNIAKWDLLFHNFRTLEAYLKKYTNANHKFQRFIEEQLLITTQTHSTKAPILTSALGLCYPSDTYYPMGGMYKPAQMILDRFQELGGRIGLNQKVVKIRKIGKIYEVVTKEATYRSKIVVSSIPIWNMAEITEPPLQRYFEKYANRFQNAPGAFVLNFAIPRKEKLETAYYQVHTSQPIPHCEAGAFFVSFSLEGDEERAPQGYQTVTISTHTNPASWNRKDKEKYKQQKREVTQIILEEFDRVFSEYKGLEKLFLLSGTPSTYERYTERWKGFVGGIPHSVFPGLLGFPPNETKFSNLYLIGDTSFPGQGIPAVLYSAMNVAERINLANQ
jgi:C-3',4' desaturase CrtD